MTTIVFTFKPFFERHEFSPGPCCADKSVTTQSYSVPIGSGYEIWTRVDPKETSSFLPAYKYELADIQGSPSCTGTDKCQAEMKPGGAYVVVNYHWAQTMR